MTPPTLDSGSSFLDRRLDAKGLRPRVAASVIAVLWLIAIFAFGLLEHLLDKDSFSNFWEGLWWATQTVTTVGYGDVVPADPLGQLIAAILMIGGLSFFAVITGWITTEFVTRAEDERRGSVEERIEEAVTEMRQELQGLREQIAALSPEQAKPDPEQPPGPPTPPGR